MFADREAAGELLAAALLTRGIENALILGLPRGGVAVAKRVSSRLRSPLDIYLARKLGAPFNPELAIGAITEDGYLWLDRETVHEFHISQDHITHERARQQAELERQTALYRHGRPAPDVSQKHVVLVDDGIATGATIRAAADGIRQRQPARLTLAAPVASSRALESLSHHADDLVVLQADHEFLAVGMYYRDFAPVTDGFVRLNLS
jgi:putative phosphoribosyl transferase